MLESSLETHRATFQNKNHLSRYGDLRYTDKMAVIPSYLHKWNSFTGKTVFLYWNRCQVFSQGNKCFRARGHDLLCSVNDTGTITSYSSYIVSDVASKWFYWDDIAVNFTCENRRQFTTLWMQNVKTVYCLIHLTEEMVTIVSRLQIISFQIVEFAMFKESFPGLYVTVLQWPLLTSELEREPVRTTITGPLWRREIATCCSHLTE